MKTTIAQLTQIAQRSTSVEAAAQALSQETPRFSTRAAREVMLDVQDFVTGVIDETKLSLFLKQHGF